ASADREAGVVFRSRTKGKPPRLRQLRWLRDIFLMTQPPLLAVMQGGECARFQFIYTVIDRHTSFHTGIKPCFLRGRSSSLDSSNSKARMRRTRVSGGVIALC